MKNTKRAFLLSCLSLLLCMSMLVGSTFAWFTDTASTAVNKIQAGTLDVVLEVSYDGGKTWEDAEGKTLDFVKAAGYEDEDILWEPGCTYTLPLLRLRNNGNLWLKYEIAITGINGDAKLNEAIDWTFSGDKWQGAIAPEGNTGSITITGHMKEEAGNEYQGLSIDGIGITVYATQYTYEHDSIDDQYDVSAPTMIMIGEEPYETLAEAITAAEDGATIMLAGNFTLPQDGSLKDKKLTFAVIEDNTAVIDLQAKTNYANGCTLTFDGVIIENGNKNYVGIAHASQITYKNCIIKGRQTLYAETVAFENCTFENYNDYSIWTWGAKNVTFTDCTFNCGGKAVLVYNGSTNANFVANVTLTNCVFNDSGNVSGKAAVETGSDGGNTEASNKYNLTFVNCTVNGYDANNSASALWGNKNSMDADHLNVVVDGATVVMAAGQTELTDTITNATGPVEVVLPAGEYTLPSVAGKDITISGDKDTVIDATDNVASNGAALTFDGVTVVFDADNYEGFQHSEKVVYKNCTIKGTQFLYSDAEFINCTFEVEGDTYAVWTYGASNVTFTDCTFNTSGKAILVYTEAAHTATITVDGCTFNCDGTGYNKAAVEVGESANGNQANYTIIIKNSTADEGFTTNHSDSNLWGNKNDMPADRLNVTVG